MSMEFTGRLSPTGTIVASLAATVGASLGVGHGEVPVVNWTEQVTHTTDHIYGLTNYEPARYGGPRDALYDSGNMYFTTDLQRQTDLAPGAAEQQPGTAWQSVLATAKKAAGVYGAGNVWIDIRVNTPTEPGETEEQDAAQDDALAESVGDQIEDAVPGVGTAAMGTTVLRGGYTSNVLPKDQQYGISVLIRGYGEEQADYCVRKMTVERDIVTTDEEREFPYPVPVVLPIPGVRIRRKEEQEEVTSADGYSRFADPVRAREIIEHADQVRARKAGGVAAGGIGRGYSSSSPTPPRHSYRVGAERSGRWPNIIIVGAGAALLASLLYQYHDWESDNIICKESGSWSFSVCLPEGEDKSQSQPESTPTPSGTPSNGTSPTPSPSAPPAKGGTPGEGGPAMPPPQSACPGLTNFTDVTLTVNDNGQVSTSEYRNRD